MRRQARTRYLRAALPILAALGLLQTANPQEAPPTPAVAGAPRTALLFFVSYRSVQLPSVAPAQLRTTGYNLLTAALGTSASEIVPYPELEPLLRTWRVRSSGSLPRGFLDAVVSQLSADTLVVAELAVFADRVLLTGRSMQCGSGHLIRVGIVEERLAGREQPGEELPTTVWMSALQKASRRLADRWSGPAPTEDATTLLVLPVVSVGAGGWQADAATVCLLEALLEERCWRIPDPALVVAVLQAEGVDPSVLGRDGRVLLSRAFGAAPLLTTELVSFEMQASRGVPGLIDEFDELGRLSPAGDTQHPLYFSMMAVDGTSGTVLHGSARYIDGEARRGLFATSRDPLLFRRLEENAARLARSLRRDWGG
jgi:hypothetical protein